MYASCKIYIFAPRRIFHGSVCSFIRRFIPYLYRRNCYVLIHVTFSVFAISSNRLIVAEPFIYFRFSMFQHPEVTRELLEINKDNATKQQLCRDIAKPGYEVVASMPSPRFIKSHFPFSLMPGILDVGCKVNINVKEKIREPRDDR